MLINHDNYESKVDVSLCSPCCDIRYNFRMKTVFGSSLPPVFSVLFTLFVFVCA
jgi:hypothetical protein